VSNTTALIALLAAAIGTYAFRSGLILVLAGRTLPSSIERALGNVAPAVLAAMTINLAVGGDGEVSFQFAELGALAIAAGVAWWRKNLLWTLAAGMVALWVLTALS
jgi:branched-subunit amino acid transport protein